MKTAYRIISCAFIYVALCSSVNAQQNPASTASEQKAFSFDVNAYLWTMSLNATAALPTGLQLIPQTPEVNVDLSFSDAIKNLKLAAMFAGKFQYNSWALLYDVDYAKLDFAATDSIRIGDPGANLVAKQFTGDFEIAYQLPMNNKKFVLAPYAGARISSLDNTIDIYGIQDSLRSTWTGSKTWADFVFGLVGEYDFSPKWFVFAKADVGGFGVSSNITWMLLGGAGYRFSEHWNARIGFKWLGMNYDKDYFLWNASQYGGLLSIGYHF